VFVIQR